MGDEYESDNDHMMTKLVLPNGTIKRDFVVRTKTDVSREKVRILSDVQLRVPPPEELMLVILDEHGNEEVMDESKKMDFYRNSISVGTIEIRDKNSAVRSTPTGHKTPLESFGVCTKQQ
ncbi:unnamed protein product [Lymnaea stagnalis]|uniref:Uncharacterized protein n=1 Tax=Lymnaea stagnalis TaxID=6523 RepID=A0AAV2HP89_LYMST